MIPLRDVMDETYAVYLFTAGTKPPQPRLGYCPHSRPNAAAGADDAHHPAPGIHHHADTHEEHSHAHALDGDHAHSHGDHDDGHGHGTEEDALFSAGAPPAPPLGRGVHWAVSPAGQMMSLAL